MKSLFITSNIKVIVKNRIQCLPLKGLMSFSFEKDWFKKLAKILKRRARDKQKKKKI